ncbi:UDP-glucosyltransferase 2-like isoform X1 [Schistocerca cancellata]|uniref:UDP-glucosyltransferase 2-like isoform X1 n=2 Tax=Schistocerca cancellata TaxID=274614 RepID=UPI002117FD45|nr:UDP-glucosyltransferase 2-like isoform X1 [Schistocerca cancellata]
MKIDVSENVFRSSFLLSLLFGGCLASKILVVAPTPSISHQKPFQILTKALLQRGHQITFFTANPLKISHENLTEIDLSVGYNIIGDLDLESTAQQSPVETMSMLRDATSVCVQWMLREPAVQSFISKRDNFDLVIMERMPYQAFFGLVHNAGSPPLVGMITLPAFAPVYHAMGNLVNPAYSPDVWVGYSDHMSFWQRAYNAYFQLSFCYMWYFQIQPTQEAIMRQYFGPGPPPVHETERNVSLLIVNSHFSVDYPRPLLPNILEITGMHVQTQTKPLPKDIQEFIDGAEHGLIYMSLGSNVRSSGLPWQKVQAFLDAFRELPQRVLWKWENKTLPGQPPNVMVSKWLPQQDILAHRKVRLFITQGGLQSMNEAMYHAVPFLAIPFFADQPYNAAKIVQAELGVSLQFNDLTKDSILQHSRAVLENQRYKENMNRLSEIFREHQADSLERAVWWLEYVIRHKGAPHMRTAALDLHWWQLLLLDVIAFIAFILMSTCAVMYAAFYFIRQITVAMKDTKRKVKKQL